MRARSGTPLILTGLFVAFAVHAAEPEDAPSGVTIPIQSDAISIVLGTLKWIPSDTFEMGSPTPEPNGETEEQQHSVTLSSGY